MSVTPTTLGQRWEKPDIFLAFKEKSAINPPPSSLGLPKVGGVAQLVERLLRMQEAGGSNPPTSTIDSRHNRLCGDSQGRLPFTGPAYNCVIFKRIPILPPLSSATTW